MGYQTERFESLLKILELMPENRNSLNIEQIDDIPCIGFSSDVSIFLRAIGYTDVKNRYFDFDDMWFLSRVRKFLEIILYGAKRRNRIVDENIRSGNIAIGILEAGAIYEAVDELVVEEVRMFLNVAEKWDNIVQDI